MLQLFKFQPLERMLAAAFLLGKLITSGEQRGV